MRTLKLTHKQIALIQQALGLAEKQTNDSHACLIKVLQARNNYVNRDEQEKAAKFWFDLSSEFADLNIDIEQGALDV